MFRSAQIRCALPSLIIIVALAGVVAFAVATQMDSEPPARVAQAPIDARIPRELSTATFGMG